MTLAVVALPTTDAQEQRAPGRAKHRVRPATVTREPIGPVAPSDAPRTLRMRVETPEGVLVVFDAARPTEDGSGCSGYSVYWQPTGDVVTHFFVGIVYDAGDLATVLQSLHRDFGVDIEELGSGHERLTTAMKARAADADHDSGWEPLTLDRAVEIMGFDPSTMDDSQDGGARVACACGPCAAGVPPPSRCDSPYALVREALAVASDCCGCGGGGNPPPPPPPPSCVCCPVLGLAAEGMGTVASCCGPDGACNDGDPCTVGDLCDNQAVYCPPLTCCGKPKNCDDGKVCTYDRCNSVGGACYYTPRCSDRLCCPADSSYFCCNAGEEVCCPRNPAYADHCCRSDQTCCGAECCLPEQTCCNGHCGLKGACCFFDAGSCSQLTEVCCAQQGGTYQDDGSACTPADLCQPRCDNCHLLATVSFECAHYTPNPSEPCDPTHCIFNSIETATCDHHPDRIGPPKCNTNVDPDPEGFFGRQILFQLPQGSSCETTNPGAYHVWTAIWAGCGEDCRLWPNPLLPQLIRCDTTVCQGTPVRIEFRRPRTVCGCSPPP